MVLEMWSARQAGQRAKVVAENRVQWRSSYQMSTREHFPCSAKGNIRRALCLYGIRHPFSDAEWDQWHQDHGNLFLCLRELPSS